MMKTLRLYLISLSLAFFGATLLPAQQTIVVDYYGGPGSQFTQIQPAIDFADPGDLILVRPLTDPFEFYGGIQVTKSIRIVGGPNVRLSVGPVFGRSIAVEDLQAGDHVVLYGLESYFGGFTFDNNQGAVHCEDLDGASYTNIVDSAQVSLRNCDLFDLTTDNSQVLLTDCTVVGRTDVNCNCGGDALAISNGSRVTVVGGDYTGESQSLFGILSPGILVGSLSTLFLAGDSGTVIRSGQPTNPLFGGSALVTYGNVVIDPRPTLLPTGSAPPITAFGSGQVTTANIPYLHTSLSGGRLTTTLEASAGAIALLYYSGIAPLFSYSPTMPDVWIGAPQWILTGSVPASGVRTDIFDLYPIPAGLSFPLQAIVFENGQVYLSNPAVVVTN